MTKRVAINGFGRIGRLTFRHLMEMDSGLEVVALNDIVPLENLVYLLKHDTVHPDPQVSIEAGDGVLHWADQEIQFSSIRNPTELPWEALDIDVAIEATGVFADAEKAAQHLEAGATRVLITAPSDGADITVCMGVNHENYDPAEHKLISNASCTTNALAVVAKVLDDEFGISYGFLTTVHAYTSSQQIVDAPSRKMRRGRAGAANIVPTTTGAAIATTRVLPQLEGKMDGLAVRVPVPAGSIIDFVAELEKRVSVESVNAAMREAAEGDLKGLLGYSEEELVSSDILSTNYSATVDAESTMVLQDRVAKVLAWYDNEWGYARRVADLAVYMLDASD